MQNHADLHVFPPKFDLCLALRIMYTHHKTTAIDLFYNKMQVFILYISSLLTELGNSSQIVDMISDAHSSKHADIKLDCGLE